MYGQKVFIYPEEYCDLYCNYFKIKSLQMMTSFFISLLVILFVPNVADRGRF